MGKNPAFQFYPSDWSRDMDEHPLEIEGFWIRICCKLWWSETPGQATKSLSRWSKALGIHHLTCLKNFKYIASNGIGNIEVNGELYTVVNRRMVRDYEIRVLRSKCGTLGGNPEFEKGKSNPYYKKDNISKQDNQKITPSSSSSTSTSKKEITIPDFLPSEVWKDFLQHRKNLKSPLTTRGQELIFKKLAEFQKAGNNPVEVLNQSIERGWKGIFEIKDGGNGGPPGRNKTVFDILGVSEHGKHGTDSHTD